MTTGAKIVATWALALLALVTSVAASDLADLVTSVVPNTTALDTAVTTKSLAKRGGAFSGRATWYDVETWVAGACGQYIDNDMHIVALNQPMYGDLDSRSSWCGKHIMIANGLKTARAVIMDACPETRQCHYGALDMSMSLFQIFHDLNLGVFDITWWVIDGSGNGSNGGGSSSGSSGSNSGGSSSSNSGNNGKKGGSNSSNDDDNDDDDDDDDDSSSSSSRAAPTNAQQSASRAAKAKAASSSSASAVSAASKQEAEQSASRASVLSSKSSASAASASKASASSRSSTASSSSSSQSSSSSSSASSGAGVARPGTGTGGGASNDDPQAGNLQNFVRVLNGMSMLVHAAAGS